MARKRRTTNTNNIVIVCEGTDTEVKYLTDLKSYVEHTFPDRFSNIRIVPTAEELVVANDRNKNKKLKEDHPWAYYIQEEDNECDYEKYKAQPTRYVREAELFVINDGYHEAWAVYDHDNFSDHAFAESHAREANVNIAFSSISFEEWILVHFERNSRPFCKSVCKKHGEDIMCGTGVHTDDCHGHVCVGGHIREQRYIPEYGKSMSGLFQQLFDRHKIAIVNAAWLRSLHRDRHFWECNPFTTVDSLIGRLLDYKQDYAWIPNTDNFTILRTDLSLVGQTIKNIGTISVAFDYEIFDANMTSIFKHNTGVITPGCTFELQVPENGVLIGILDRTVTKVISLG